MTKVFARFARRAGLEDSSLAQAAHEVVTGAFDADLGGHVYKQRVARIGEGKSGGFRTIILFKIGSHSIFAHGFAKNDKANISGKELKAFKRLAEILLALSDVEIGKAITAGEFVKVMENGDQAQED
ncbi:type II toxin-antitoxin system RelE/ParE family toxin [Sphingomonas sp. MMS24-J13]|uniref:type II toxin-antitoxin system RelE/ParE family toxin n=1 Tax=Sphingomonas sp. MMS24-J13 TaxID=3238686 RepID=UPI00384BE3D0